MKTLNKKSAAKMKKSAKTKTKATKKPKTAKVAKAKKQTQKPHTLEQAENIEELSEDLNKSFEYNVETSFFYTNDKFINALDNDLIMQEILKHYPDLSVKNTDSAIKKNILHLLEDENFVESVLKFYNISVFDLFKLLYKLFSSVFKGMYLVKVRKAIADKKYATIVSRYKHK